VNQIPCPTLHRGLSSRKLVGVSIVELPSWRWLLTDKLSVAQKEQ
jgi:hypothetical protein